MVTKSKILVVEDNLIVAEGIKKSLLTLGYTVSAIVSSKEEALKQTEKDQPDLVLMDIVLQGKTTGIDTAEEIRLRFDVPVVYLTAYSDEATLEKAKVTEPFGYLLKPFSDSELHSIIEMALYKHRTEKTLRENEKKYKTLFESSLDGVFVLNAETMKIVLANRAAMEIYGFESLDEVVGLNPLDFIPEEDRERTRKIIVEDMFENDLREVNEFRTIDKNGKEIWISASGVRTEYQGRLAGLISIRDITQRKLAEKALRASEERYRGLFETMSQGVLYYDANKRVIGCNPAAEKIFDTTQENLIGQSLFDEKWQILKEDGSPFPKEEHPVVISFYSGKSVPDVVIGIVTPGGNQKWLLVNATPVFEPGKRKPRYVFAICTDITNRKKIEFDLKKRNVQLNSLNVISRAVSGTLDLKTIMNKALREVLNLAEFSAGALFLLNEEKSSISFEVHRGISSMVIKYIAQLHAEKSSSYRDFLMRGEAKLFPINELREEEKPGNENTKEDREVTAYCLLIPIKVGHHVVGSLNLFGTEKYIPSETDFNFFSTVGSHIGLAVRNASLYEKTKHTLKKLKTTQDKLIRSEKLASLGVLASNIVHELGNPLAAIINSVQVLQERVHLEGKMKELMDIIEWESERLNRIVNQLREFSKPKPLKFVMADLREIVKKAILVLNQDFELIWDRNIKTKFPGDLPLTLLDPDSMEQVVLNVIKNGLQAIQPGGTVEVKITCIGRKEKRKIRMQVRDNGSGIPEEKLQHIFEPYFSTKAKGMGLGMHIVKQAVESHNGAIRINSELGKGTTVLIDIPIRKEENG